MNTFTYSPTAYKVADTYQNYNTGGTKAVLNDNDIVQFKNDTDKAFGQVQNVCNDHRNELFKLTGEFESLKKANRVAFESLAWIEHHYPEVMHALDSTMKVTVVLDKANNLGSEVMGAP
jgi:hypothetical protein